MAQQGTLEFRDFFFLWFGAAVSVAEILAGGLLMPLGFTGGVAAIVLGHLVGTTLLVLCGLIGVRERIPAIESTRISFGAYGSYLFSALNVLQLLGWTAVMIIAAARSVNEISRTLWGLDSFSGWAVAIGGLIMVWIALGREGGWKKANMAAVLLLFGLTVVLSATVFKGGGALGKPPAAGMSFGAGLELSVVMPLSWLPLIADYTRFARTGAGACWGSWLGYFLGSCWMYVIGLGAALATGSADPAAMMLAADLGLAALAIVVLATVTTTFMDAYSAGVSFTNFSLGLDERRVALVMTAIGTLLALVVDMEKYEAFLLAIGSVFAPLFAILLTDYYLRRNRGVRPELLANWGALAVWGGGVALYYQVLELQLAVGATIPVMVATGLVYLLVGRCAEKWQYCRKSPALLPR